MKNESTGDLVASAALSAALGLVIGVAGAFVIRIGGSFPIGLAVALIAFGAGALLTRSLAGIWSFAPFVVAAAIGIALTAFVAPGGDVILLVDWVTVTWVLASGVLAVIVAALPRRWFNLWPSRLEQREHEDLPDM
ncbi:MAG TPA: hypothetical protein VFC82_05720 [Actinomycetaceae bacterium]|nr:hypothetical protein [Actinomycetaceae bacterium]